MKILCHLSSLKAIFDQCDVEQLEHCEVRDSQLFLKSTDHPARTIPIQRIDASSDRVWRGGSQAWVSVAELIEQLPADFKRDVVLNITPKIIHVIFECA